MLEFLWTVPTFLFHLMIVMLFWGLIIGVVGFSISWLYEEGYLSKLKNKFTKKKSKDDEDDYIGV